MANLNRVFLIGNLTRDPELKYTQSGLAVCEFGLAVNRTFKTDGQEREETLFVEITVFAKQAETANEYLAKGRPVFIEGRLKLDQWEDKTTGQKRSKHSVIGERFQFLGGRNDSDQDKGQQNGGSGSTGQTDVGNDDIPF